MKKEEATRYLKDDFCIEAMQEIYLVKLPISRGLVLLFVKYKEMRGNGCEKTYCL